MAPPLLFDLRGKRIYVAGHTGLAGSAIVRRLASEGCEVLTAKREDLDLTQQDATEKWIATAKPDAVFLAAARVGGIYANDAFPADFLADNLAIAVNVLRAALAVKVKKLMFLGSSCIYPREAQQPVPETALLTGPLEPTNEPYAIAKIAGIIGQKLKSLGEMSRESSGGVRAVAEMFNRLDSSTSKEILDAIEQNDPALVETLERAVKKPEAVGVNDSVVCMQRASIRRRDWRSGRPSSSSPSTAPPCCSPRSTWRRPTTWPTASPSSTSAR